MFDFFGSLFGPSQSKQSKASIQQLYELNASFQAALLEELQNSKILSKEQVAKLLKRRNLLIEEFKKTMLEDTWEDYGHNGKGDLNGNPTKSTLCEPTCNTWNAIFALINNQWDEFKNLITEGPSPEAIEQHEDKKQRLAKIRQDVLEKQANCKHDYSGLWSTRDQAKCTKCEKRR